jgi:antirestriction protein ArdC
MKPEVKRELYKTVTADLIAQMEQGVAIWQKPWVTSKAHAPRNGVSDRAYNGFNRIYLGMLQDAMGSTDPRWYTMNNANELGHKIAKGSKSTIVVFNGPASYDRENDEGEVETKTYWKTKYYRVYHASMVEGLEPYETDSKVPVQPDADERYIGIDYLVDWCSNNLHDLHIGGTKASYSPTLDRINMPSISQFKRQSWYAQTLAHEIIHATGHESRQNRLDASSFGTEPYAREELIAEFGAAMLCGTFDIPADLEQSASYLKGWAEACADDPGLLIGAANAAERAVDFVTEDMYAVA